jgi:hypothetical protein
VVVADNAETAHDSFLQIVVEGYAFHPSLV